MHRKYIWFYIIFCILGAPTHAESPLAWTSLEGIPKDFQGRWAQSDVDGKIGSDACRKNDTDSADLFIGLNWFVHSSGQGFYSNVEQSSDGSLRVQVVDNGGGEVGVTLELMSLTGDKLEISSNPESGWDISRYTRCGARDD